MNWFLSLFTSSIGKKLIMSLTGLFLILFLVVHLSGNLQLLADDGGKAFNEYTVFMTTNPLVKTISYGLYFFIILHAIQGIVLKLQNNNARGVGYRKKKARDTSWASRQMALLGILVLAFLFLHMGDFWYQMKFGEIPPDQWGNKDLYLKVKQSFSNIWIVIAYLVGLLALAFHLFHGFESAFQTIGLHNDKWKPVVKWIGYIYSVLIPLGFAIIPIVFYFKYS